MLTPGISGNSSYASTISKAIGGGKAFRQVLDSKVDAGIFAQKSGGTPLTDFLTKSTDLFSMISGKSSSTRAKSLFEVGQDYKEDLADFSNILGSFFSMAGIGTSTPMYLKPDGKGHVFAEGGAEGTKTVNEMFAGNSKMVSRFMVVQARATLLGLAESDAGFNAAYNSNPFSAIDNYEEQLKEKLLGSSMKVHNNTFTPEV